MKKTGIVFGGQGSQYEQMGRRFLEHPKTKHIYDEIADYHDIVKNGSTEELSKTENLQPIMLAFQVATIEFLKEKENAVATCGLSLGEYGSLVLAEVLNYKDALSLVKRRGKLMQEESEEQDTQMIAVLNQNEEQLHELIRKASFTEELFISNINSPKQIVVAGERKKVARFKKYLAEKKIRSMDLHVSGAFHTPYMKRASQRYFEELKKIDFAPPTMNYYLNRTGKKYSGEDMRRILAEHIDHPVRLFDNLKNMIDEGVERIIEIGPGDVLSRIIKKHFNEVEVISLKNEEDIMKR